MRDKRTKFVILLMICKLCLKKTELLKKSHIIPDFMYQMIYDEKHFLYRGSAKNLDKMQTVPTGEYDSNILCKKCDNEIIGSYESYASGVFFGGLPQNNCPTFKSGMINDIHATIFENLEYDKFKLFLLSMLWRASISKRKFFKNVNLGKDEEIIRNLLLSGKAGDDNRYPILISSFIGLKNIPSDVIGEPHNFDKNKMNGYAFLISGFFVAYFLSNKGVSQFFLDASIKKTNKMILIHHRPKSAIKLIKIFFNL